MNKKTSRDVRTDEDIRQWEARLGREWPERAQMVQYIANYVGQLPVEAPIVVELAVGSGYLSESLLRVLPKIAYIGFDRSAALLNYARLRLEALGPSGDYQLHLADVNEDAWVSWLEEAGLVGKIDVVVSLQSFHDFGKEPQQARAYRIVRQILSPQGHLINADLLLNPQKPHPRRLPASRHLQLLRETGFAQAECPLQIGELGCFVALA